MMRVTSRCIVLSLVNAGVGVASVWSVNLVDVIV